jgi:acyl-homoserine-lactone acylase
MKILTLVSLLLVVGLAQSQTINSKSIDIVRDRWGVPHIFSKTDAGVSYGLAWAHAEDDFKTIQQGFLVGKAMLGLYSGKQGATIDYIVQFLQCRRLVDERYEQDISSQYKAVLQAYADGINSYAAAHPDEVLVKKLFPVAPEDMLTYSVLQLAISCGADRALKEISEGTVPMVEQWAPGGSNAFAFNSKITEDGNVYLAINSHQPLEGPVAWYEAHLQSEEGWNILGALFPGSPSILHGCNENLGWAHTVNNPDKLDVYQLELNLENKNQYKLDGRWEELVTSKVRLKVKIAGIPITVKKEIHESKFGPTMVNKKGAFAIRTGALMEIRALEQWYRMNKAKNFNEFKKILDMGAIPGYNIVYADRFDTIYYLSNGKLPIRNSTYKWNSTLAGNTSQTLWTNFHSVNELPHLLNPSSGYVFNSNHSPFNASSSINNLKVNDFDSTMGYETNDNNRSLRFMELIAQYPKLNYDNFKKIKYDLQLPTQLAYQTNADSLFLLQPNEFPALSGIISTLNQWDRKTTIDSKAATIFSIVYYQVVKEQKKGAAYRTLSKKKSIELLTFAKEYLIKHFGKMEVTLGEYQKLVRGDKVVSLPGIPDVISAMHSAPYKNGMVKGEQGESYIELVKFTSTGPEMETINCYGASNNPKSEHYADQMEMFIQQKTKPMTLNKEKIYKEAKRVYHPE